MGHFWVSNCHLKLKLTKNKTVASISPVFSFIKLRIVIFHHINQLEISSVIISLSSDSSVRVVDICVGGSNDKGRDSHLKFQIKHISLQLGYWSQIKPFENLFENFQNFVSKIFQKILKSLLQTFFGDLRIWIYIILDKKFWWLFINSTWLYITRSPP